MEHHDNRNCGLDDMVPGASLRLEKVFTVGFPLISLVRATLLEYIISAIKVNNFNLTNNLPLP